MDIMSNSINKIKKQNPQGVVGVTQNSSAYQANLQQPVQQAKWYAGDKPTSREMLGKIYDIYQQDNAYGQKMLDNFHLEQQNPASDFYAPYSIATNKSVSNLNSLGVDTSNIDDNWFNQTKWLDDYLIYDGTTLSPSKPGKNATAQQMAAYERYQIEKANGDTKAVDSEWAALQQELAWMATKDPRHLSDDAIVDSIDWRKYPTLKKLTDSLTPGSGVNMVELNHGTDFSTDNLYGAIWAARNNGGAGSAEANTMLAALGKGNVWQQDESTAAKLNKNDLSTYDPYSVGSTMYDACMYFGVPEFSDEEIANIESTLDWNDKTQVDMLNALKAANETTKNAEAELAELDGKVTAMVEDCWEESDIMRIIDRTYASMETLNAMNVALDNRNPVNTTHAINGVKIADIKKKASEMIEKRNNGLVTLGQTIADTVYNLAGKIFGTEDTTSPATAPDSSKQVDAAKDVAGKSVSTEKEDTRTPEVKVEAGKPITTTPAATGPVNNASNAVAEAEQRNLNQMAPYVSETGTDEEKVVWNAGRSTQFEEAATELNNVADADHQAVIDGINAGLEDQAVSKYFRSLDAIDEHDALVADREKYTKELHDTNLKIASLEAKTRLAGGISGPDAEWLNAAISTPEWEEAKKNLQSDKWADQWQGYGYLYNYVLNNREEGASTEYRPFDGSFLDVGNVSSREELIEKIPKLEEFARMALSGEIGSGSEDYVLTINDEETLNELHENADRLETLIAETDGKLDETDAAYQQAVADRDGVINSYAAAAETTNGEVNTDFLTRLDNIHQISKQYMRYSTAPNDQWDMAIAEGQAREEIVPYVSYAIAQDMESINDMKWALENAEALGLTEEEVRNIQRGIDIVNSEMLDAVYFSLDDNEDFDATASAAMKKGATDDMSDLTKRNVDLILNGYHQGIYSDNALEATWDRIKSKFIGNMDDPFYEQFFGKGEGATNEQDSGIQQSLIKRAGEQMTEEEKKRYFYLLATDGEDAANAYFKHLVNTEYGKLSNRVTESIQEEFHNLTSQGGVGAVLGYGLSFATNFIGNIQNIASGVLNRAKGKTSGNNDVGELGSKITDELRGGVTEFINKTYEGDTAEFANFLINALTSGVDSRINAIATSEAFSMIQDLGSNIGFVKKAFDLFNGAMEGDYGGLLKFGSNAVNDWAHAIPMAWGAAEKAYDEAMRDPNLSPEQAEKIRNATFWAESVSEAITYGNIKQMWNKGLDGDVKGFFRELFSNGMEEAVGEGFNQWWEDNADREIKGRFSEYDQMVDELIASGVPRSQAEKMANSQMVKNILVAAASGFVSSVGGGAVDYAAGQVASTSYQNTLESIRQVDMAKLAYAKKSANNTTTAATISAILRNNVAVSGKAADATNAAAQHIIADMGTGSAVNAVQMMEGIVAAAGDDALNAKTAIVYSALTRDVSNRTLKDIAEKASNGIRITQEDVQGLISAVEMDQTGPNAKQNQATFDNTVYENRVATTVMKTLAADVSKADRDAIKGAEVDLDKAWEAAEQAKDDVKKAKDVTAVKSNAVADVLNRIVENPGDDNLMKLLSAAKADLEGALTVESQMEMHLDEAVKGHDRAVGDFEDMVYGVMNKLRQEAQETVAQDDQQREEQAKTEAEQQEEAERAAEEEAEIQRQALKAMQEDNAVSRMEADTFVEEYYPDATDEQKETIRLTFAKARREYGFTAKGFLQRRGFVKAIEKKFGVKIKVGDTTEGGTRPMQNANVNLKTGEILLDVNSTMDDLMYAVLDHELTHIAERSGTYSELADMVLQTEYGDEASYQGILDAMSAGDVSSRLAQDILAKKQLYDKKLNKEHSYEDILQEVVADKVGKILSGDEAALQQLAAEKPNLARRILDSIKSFLKKMAGIEGAPVSQAQKVADMLEKALNEATIQNTNGSEVKHMITFFEDTDRVLDGRESQGIRDAWNEYSRGERPDAVPRENGGIAVAIRDAVIYTDNNGRVEFAIDAIDPDLMVRNNIQQDLLKFEREGKNLGTQYRILESVYGKGHTNFRIGKSSQRYLGQISRGAGLNQRIEINRVRAEVPSEEKYSIPLVTDSNGNALASELPGGTVATTPETKASLSSFTAEEREKVRQALLKSKRFTTDQVNNYIDNALGLAALIAADRTRLDYDVTDPEKSMVKSNSDYGASIDASTLCAKRLVYQGTFDAISHLMPNTPLTPEDLIRLSDMMREMGYETPCGLCYVESRRRNLDSYIADWLKTYKGDDTGYIPTIADVSTTDGLEEVRKNHPKVYEDFMYAMKHDHGTQGNPKVVQLRTEYKGEIRDLSDRSREKFINHGGIRIQSFSDFETPHLLDMVQVVMDIASKNLTSQAYTKVPNFAWVFGDTGIKINLSLIGKGTGLDENGNLVFDDVEGMPIDQAMALRDRYSKNVGTILVGMNDAHILAAMADPRIDYIIPFHRSGWTKEDMKLMSTLEGYQDYQDYQTEKDIDTGAKTKKNKGNNIAPVGAKDEYGNGYWEFDKSGKENAEKYLDLCYKNGLIPVFPQFLDKDSDGHYHLKADGSTDGYWKLLIDFKMYDNDGKGAPQLPVTPDINMDQAIRVLNEYDLSREQPGGRNGLGTAPAVMKDNNSLPVAQPVVDRFVEEYKANHPLDENRTKYSLSEAIDNVFEDMSSDELADLLGIVFGDNEADAEEEAKQVITSAVQDIKDEFDPNIYNGRLYVKPETMDYWLSGSGFASSNPNYAQAYIAMMDPADFLRMSTTRPEVQQRILNEATTLDEERLSENAERQPIQLIIDEEAGKVMGHEGRHRAVALARAGVKEMPVLLFDSTTKYSKTPKAEMTLKGQNPSFDDSVENGNELTFTDVIPLSGGNRDEIFQRFVETGEDEANARANNQRVLKYSLPSDDVLQDMIADYIRNNNTPVNNTANAPQLEGNNQTSRGDAAGYLGGHTGYNARNGFVQFDNAPSQTIIDNLGRVGMQYNSVDRTWTSRNANVPLDDILNAIENGNRGITISAPRRANARRTQANGPTASEQGQTQQPTGEPGIFRLDEFSAPLEGMSPAMSTSGGPAQRQFGAGMLQDSNEVSQRVKDIVLMQNGRGVDTNADQLDRAIKWIRSNKQTPNSDGLYESIQQITSNRFDYRTADGQARMVATMAMAVAKQDTMAQVALADAFNRHGTDLGRALQARKLFRMMTPEGRISTIQKMLDEQQNILNAKGTKVDLKFSDWVYMAAAAANNEADMEKVQQAAAKELADQLPISWKDRLRGWRMLSMLGNPRTHIRNVIGNALFVPAVSIKNKLSAVAELGLKEGNRTKTLAPVVNRTIREFARQDAVAMKDVLTGEAKYNEMNAVQKEQRNFRNNVLQALSDFNSNMLEKEDWFFLKGHYIRALGGWMQANGYTAADMRANPSMLEQGRAYAIEEAQKATYRDFNQLAATLNQVSRKGGVAGFLVDATLPFKKTPANILRRGIEYSPVGIAKTLAADAYHLKQYLDYQKGKLNALPEKAITPNQFIDKICAGLTGTAIMAVGVLLGSAGVVSVGLDDDDDKFEKEQGGQEYAIRFNLLGQDVTFTMDWAAPMSMPFFVGAAVYEQIANGGDVDIESMINAMAAISEPVFNLSMMDGINTLFKTSQYNTEETNPITQIGAKIGSNYLTSFVPSVLGATARTLDPVRRKAFVESGKGNGVMGTFRYAWEQTENKIPGVSQSNIPYRDIWGNAEESPLWERIAENFVLPGYISEYKDDPILNEMERLYEVTGEKGLIPSDPGKSFTYKKEKYVLTAEQWDAYKVARGQAAHDTLEALMATENYQKAGPEEQAQLIVNAWSYADAVGKAAVVPGYEVTGYGKDPVTTISQNGAKTYYKGELLKALKAEDMDTFDTCVEALKENGMEDSAIKTAIADSGYRDEYKAAYRRGDDMRMLEIEETLDSTGYDYDFAKWRKDEQKKMDEE